MMVAPLVAASLHRDYSDYIAVAYGVAAVLFVALTVQSIAAARAVDKELADMTPDAKSGGDDAA